MKVCGLMIKTRNTMVLRLVADANPYTVSVIRNQPNAVPMPGQGLKR